MLTLVLLTLGQLDAGSVGSGVEASLELLGTPYEWGGRLRKKEGIDCYGVVLAAAERASGCGWRSYPVKPTEIVAKQLWGAPVEGLSPISTKALTLESLQAGDVLMLIGTAQNPAEPAVGLLDGTPVWVWHVGLYLGDGRYVVGDHHAGKTVIEPLLPYLEAHRDEYAGVFVTRGPAKKPANCRRHPPLAPARIRTRAGAAAEPASSPRRTVRRRGARTRRSAA